MNRRNRSWNRLISAALSLLIIGAAAAASSHHHHNDHQASQPGVFDFYVFALSWSPEFCHSHATSPECQTGHLGFTVHGLWPEFVNGYPENCSTEPGLSDPKIVADIMPDPRLVEHEWSTHGTCSGLDPDHYFKLIRQAFASVKIPQRFAQPTQPFSLTPAEIKQEFLQSNPSLKLEDVTVSCGNNYLTGVSLCMNKSLDPAACQGVNDCRANSIKVPPVK
jgi:ribonuclease T2